MKPASIGALRFAEAAEALVGTRFRLHGREVASGLDCVGLIEAALVASGRKVSLPLTYALKMRTPGDLSPLAEALGFTKVDDAIALGDVLLLNPGPCQYHFAIASASGGYVHAHAGLRRVVHTPARPEGQILHHWRMISEG